MPIVLGWRTDVGVVGGRLLFLESFIDHVLIRLPRPAPTSVWRRLPYLQPLATGTPIGWAVGMGAGASRAAQRSVSGGRGGTRKLRVGVDRFEGSVRAPRLLCPEAQMRRHAARRAAE